MEGKELAAAITAGYGFKPSATHGYVLGDGQGRRIAGVLPRKVHARVSLRDALPPDAPAELLKAAAVSGDSGWSHDLVVTDEAGIQVARALLAYVTVAAPKPAAKAPKPAKAKLRAVKGGKAAPA